MNKKKIIKRTAITTLIAAPLVFLATPLGVGFSLTHPKQKKSIQTPADFDLDYEEVTFPSTLDGCLLHGWWIPAKEETNKTVITVHGYRGEKTQASIEALKLVKVLHEEGYNVCMFDFRNSGESEKAVTGIGYFEQHDLTSVIDYVCSEKKQASMALIGWSMGAATSLVVGAKDSRVQVVIADSPFSDLTQYLKTNMSTWTNLPQKPFTSMILYSMKKLLHIHPEDVSPINEVKEASNKAYLLIHSKEDTKIPYEESVAIFEAIGANATKELWLTEQAEHIRSYVVYGEAYEKKVTTFLQTAWK